MRYTLGRTTDLCACISAKVHLMLLQNLVPTLAPYRLANMPNRAQQHMMLNTVKGR